MGTACMRDNRKFTYSQLPIYEQVCSRIEEELNLPSIDIEKFEEALNLECYSSKEIDNELLAKVYKKFGISESVFLDPLAPYTNFFDALTDNKSDKRRAILTGVLPFCSGRVQAKKSVLWVCLDCEKENAIDPKLLSDTVIRLIVHSAKTIPYLVNRKPLYKEVPDTDLYELLHCDQKVINEYATTVYGLTENSEKMKKTEFEEWFEWTNADKLFCSAHLRKSMLRCVKLQNASFEK